MMTSRNRFEKELWVVDVTRLVDPLVPVHGVVDLTDPDRFLEVAGSLVNFKSLIVFLSR